MAGRSAPPPGPDVIEMLRSMARATEAAASERVATVTTIGDYQRLLREADERLSAVRGEAEMRLARANQTIDELRAAVRALEDRNYAREDSGRVRDAALAAIAERRALAAQESSAFASALAMGFRALQGVGGGPDKPNAESVFAVFSDEDLAFLAAQRPALFDRLESLAKNQACAASAHGPEAEPSG